MIVFFKNWSFFEIIWLLTFLVIGTFVTVFTQDSFLNYIVLITGILCVVLVAKANIWNYFIGTINTVLYAYIAYKNGLFGEVGLYLLFFCLPM